MVPNIKIALTDAIERDGAPLRLIGRKARVKANRISDYLYGKGPLTNNELERLFETMELSIVNPDEYREMAAENYRLRAENARLKTLLANCNERLHDEINKAMRRFEDKPYKPSEPKQAPVFVIMEE